MNAVDLEILLYRTEKDDYGVDLRFRGAGAVDIPLVRGRAEIDVRALDEAIAEDEAGESYGKVLFGQLFTRRRPELINYFDMARVAAQTAGAALRVRLYIDPTASCLHNLRWESLRDPRSGMPLLMGESIHFSRYLSSSDWRPVQLRPQDDLRALVVIADPSDLNEYRMAKVRVADELARAKAGLGAIPATVVTGPGTLGHMMEALHDEHDLLYLVCHGGIDRRTNEPRLWLEGADGRAAVTAGGEVVARLMDLWDRPRLVVLASCQSAGLGEDARSGDDLGVLAAIGPKLAGAGLPAVLAMQGSITMKTVELFMPPSSGSCVKMGGSTRLRPSPADWCATDMIFGCPCSSRGSATAEFGMFPAPRRARANSSMAGRVSSPTSMRAPALRSSGPACSRA